MSQPPDFPVYRFQAVVERTYGPAVSHFHVMFPHSVEDEFGTRGTVRVICRIGGQEYYRALIPSGNGTHFLILNQEMRRTVGANLGSTVSIEVVKDPDPDRLIIPEEIEAALEMEPRAADVFNSLTVGTRRGMCLWVDSGKRPETRANRAAELLRRLLSGTVEFGGRKVK